MLWRYRRALLAAAILLALPPLTVLLMRRDSVQLDAFETGYTDTIDNAQIVELLNGERLAPPPALPPEVFVIAETERQQLGQVAAELIPDKIVSADRRWDAIDPAFQQRVLAIYAVMKQRGYEMALVEGYRSPARQAELSAAGKATRAKAGQSCHQYGLAVDSAILKAGKLQWNMNDPWVKDGYFLYGELAEQAGLTWGGNWRSIKDYVHVEAKTACRDARRRAGHG
ncbi:M15 family metallopeptidase [Lysobacter sp. 5GHs7-4]|uniref:M15 family metallopeptidase n=1 Tax=Lysobacter sp. 5GHs7-4 TaxID=2904253 RepID=UPI001E28C21B|nr:M15 family metallopeptidase [Lysobacter sp. 5GHs7-4]UHQ21449.1 M15 family metallopeptidase [Lysobacter sp. 5GHs7-4]